MGTLGGARVTGGCLARGEHRARRGARIRPWGGRDARCAAPWTPRHRRDFMVQHTGQHIFSQALVRAEGWRRSPCISATTDTTIELQRRGGAAERCCGKRKRSPTRIITENRRVILHEIDRAEASRFPLRRRRPTRGACGSWRWNPSTGRPAAGVHVALAGEVFLIKAVSQEKIRGRVRLHVMIGSRAFEDYGRKIALAQALSRVLTCGEGSIEQRVQELLVRERESARELRRLRLAQAAADADDSVSAARSIGAVPCVRRAFRRGRGGLHQGVCGAGRRRPRAGWRSPSTGLDSSFQWIVAHSLGDGLDLRSSSPVLLDAAEQRAAAGAARMQGVGPAPGCRRSLRRRHRGGAGPHACGRRAP